MPNPLVISLYLYVCLLDLLLHIQYTVYYTTAIIAALFSLLVKIL